MVKLNLQLFGGRGASSGSDLGNSGGDSVGKWEKLGSIWDYADQNPKDKAGVDEYLKAVEEMHDRNNADGFEGVATEIDDMFVARVDGPTLAFFGEGVGMAINHKFLNQDKMNKAYDACVKQNFHPGRGDMSGVYATMSHELGHSINYKIAHSMKLSAEAYAKNVIKEATSIVGKKATDMAKSISGYATTNNKECIAEAVADVRCNGSKANVYSRTIYNILKRDYKA